MASADATALAIPGPAAVATISTEQNAANLNKLELQITELLVSSYDPVVGKTIWQCAQCHFSSKFRYTVKEHIETHLDGFTHQCPQCEKICKTRNALRAHVMRAHSTRQPPNPSQQQQQQQQNWQMQNSSPVMNPEGMMQVQVQEMADSGPRMKERRPRQRRPYDEELERQIRLLLISSYDPVEVKTTWHCAQCQFSSKLQYTVKQHIETHITTIVHQCALCPKILKTRNALRAHMNQKHEPKRIQSPPWMGGQTQNSQMRQGQFQNQVQHVQQAPRQRRKRSELKSAQTPMDLELDRQVNELMVSNYDASIGKTSWQCAQCHFTSKIRSTVKEHIETHISGFLHQCPYCPKTTKTRNALRVHVIRGHNKPQQFGQQPGPSNSSSPPKICYEPQPQQNSQQSNPQNNPQNNQQNNNPQNNNQQQIVQQNSQHSSQQNLQPIAKKSVQVEQKSIMYQPEAQKEQPRQNIMNHPGIGRPMYGHPMMMGHPMI